jgi:hypothetical protein
MAHFSSSELAALRRLRARFLEGPAEGGDYWRSEEELAIYDGTFAERIGWKWDAVVGELSARGWAPRAKHVLDWGCGSGVAGRRVVEHWANHFQTIALYDRSPLAMRFAAGRHAGIEARHGIAPELLPDSLVLVSHVLNELRDAEVAPLLELLGGARELIWVEPGTHAESRRLGAAVREPLRAAGFVPVAPCPHAAACGMLDPENARHWCHSFARPPSAIFQDARWSELARELGIDLRSLPYSFLVMQRGAAGENAELSRMIGHPREYKGFMKILSCQADGVAELTLQKRDALGLWKAISKGGAIPLYRWERNGERITGGEAA